MLGWRLFLGPLIIAALIGLLRWDVSFGKSAPVLLALALALAMRSTWELVDLLRVRRQPNYPLLWLLVLAVVASNWWWVIFGVEEFGATSLVYRMGAPSLVFALGALALFVSGLARYRAPGESMETLGVELLVLVYAGLLVATTAQLRWIGPIDAGYLPLSSLLVATKCGDTSAFFIGRWFGKTKLSPLVSPGKTQAGGVGALVGAAAGSVAWFHWGVPAIFGVESGSWYWVALYGLVLGLVGLVGDLAESLIKRDVGKKDSAPLLPGFGGLLDLLDSILFASPVAAVLWNVLPLVTER